MSDISPLIIDSFTEEYSFLSNFYPCRVFYEGMEFPTAEHAYQAQKTTSTIDRETIAMLETPGQAKRFGSKEVTLRPDWESIKIRIMHEVLLSKFLNNPELKQKLLDTGTIYLEEGNNWGDRYWGTVAGKGKNMLGLLLMEVRMTLAGGWLEVTVGRNV